MKCVCYVVSAPPVGGGEEKVRFSSVSCIHLCRYWALRSSLKNTKAARPNKGKTPSIRKALNASLPDIESSSLETIPSPPIPYLGLSTRNGRGLDDSSEAEINFDECSLNFLGFFSTGSVPERSRRTCTRPLVVVLPPVLHLAIICNTCTSKPRRCGAILECVFPRPTGQP